MAHNIHLLRLLLLVYDIVFILLLEDIMIRILSLATYSTTQSNHSGLDMPLVIRVGESTIKYFLFELLVLHRLKQVILYECYKLHSEKKRNPYKIHWCSS